MSTETLPSSMCDVARSSLPSQLKVADRGPFSACTLVFELGLDAVLEVGLEAAIAPIDECRDGAPAVPTHEVRVAVAVQVADRD